jgi:hypothetical protein
MGGERKWGVRGSGDEVAGGGGGGGGETVRTWSILSATFKCGWPLASGYSLGALLRPFVMTN